MSTDGYGDTLVEALRRANPVPVRVTEGRRAMPSAHALYADIIAESPPRRPSRARSRAVVIVIAIILLVLALVAFVAVRSGKPSEASSVVCYSAASLDAQRIVVGPAGDPEQACASVWSNGGFAALGVKAHAAAGFDVCVLPTGVAAVFPGESGSVCPGLHLPSSKGGDANVVGFAAAVDAQLNATCTRYAPAERVVKRELKKWRLHGWTITRSSRPFDADNPCAAVAVDAEKHEVGIVSYPGARRSP
jgi:hypothetical protein